MHKHARILLFMVMHQGIAMFNKLEFLKNHNWKSDLQLFVIGFCHSINISTTRFISYTYAKKK